MNLINIILKKPVTSAMFFIAAIIFGVVSMLGMETQLFPNMNVPATSVVASLPDGTPSEVENQVTRPLRESLMGINGVKQINSTSNAGQSYINIIFNDNVNVSKMIPEISKRINGVAGRLPSKASTPMVQEFSADNQPIFRFNISGNGVLSDKYFMENEVRPALERINGITSVKIDGLNKKKITMNLNEDALVRYGVTMDQISSAISSNNKDTYLGSLKVGDKTIAMKSAGKIENLKALKQIIVNTSKGAVMLGDLGVVNIVNDQSASISYVDGKPCINVSIKKAPSANTVTITDKVKQALAKLEAKKPNYQINILNNQGEEINSSVKSVVDAALLGAFFAVVVLLIFMRSIRTTLVIAVSIPVSILMSFIFIKATGTSFNMVSLAGLSLGVGMLVDNAIVVIENIFRYLQDGENPMEAARKGVSQVAGAILGSTLTTIAVFFPTMFATGFTATLFKDLSITIIASLGSSLIVAISLVPMLSSRFLRTKDIKFGVKKDGESKMSKWMERYTATIKWSLAHRKTVLAMVLAALIASGGLVMVIGVELMADSPPTNFTISVSIPKGEGRQRLEPVTKTIYGQIKDREDIEKVALDLYKENGTAYFTVNFAKGNTNTKLTINEISNAVQNKYAGVNVTVDANYSSYGNISKGISVQIKGTDSDSLLDVKAKLAKELSKVDGIKEIKDKNSSGDKEYVLRIDKGRLRSFGLTEMDIVKKLNQRTTQSLLATEMYNNGQKMEVVLSRNQQELDDVKELMITNASGGTYLIKDFATIEERSIPNGISTTDGNYSASLKVVTDLSMTEITPKIQSVINSFTMPSGFRAIIGGETEQLASTFSNLAIILGLAVMLVYMVLASQFESFKQPFIILGTVPLSIIGVVIGHLIFRTKIGALSLMGMIMLAGMIVNGAIVLLDYVGQLRKEGYGVEEALIKASTVRLRPIMMTALTTILAMLPIALGMGQGSNNMAPMAVAVVGGLAFGTVLTLVVVPVIYLMMYKEKKSKLTTYLFRYIKKRRGYNE